MSWCLSSSTTDIVIWTKIIEKDAVSCLVIPIVTKIYYDGWLFVASYVTPLSIFQYIKFFYWLHANEMCGCGKKFCHCQENTFLVKFWALSKRYKNGINAVCILVEKSEAKALLRGIKLCSKTLTDTKNTLV